MTKSVTKGAQHKSPSPPGGSFWIVPLICALALCVPMLITVIVALHEPQLKRDAFASLEITARLKAKLVELWLAERMGDLRVVSADSALIERIASIRQGADSAENERLHQRLDSIRQNYGYPAATLLDSQGAALLKLGVMHDISAQTAALLSKIDANGEVEFSYANDVNHAFPSLDFIVPLSRTARGRRKFVAALVLHTEPAASVFPLILTWPTPSKSGENLLVRADGDAVVYMTALRYANAPPRAASGLPSAATVRLNQAGRIRGSDYRGADVLAAYQPIAGTDWSVVTKIDYEEVMAPLWKLVFWVGLLGATAVLTIGAILRLLWLQQARLYRLASDSRDDAETANRAKSEFLAHMSHEIRTPMNAIVGAARLIEQESLTPRQRGYAQVMRQASRSLLLLIDDILDLSKIEAGGIELKMLPFALAPLIDELADTTTVLAHHKALKIIFDVAAGLPPLLIGDAFRLQQVLGNLLSNAVKFTDRGQITLHVQSVFADSETIRLRFVVSDTGIGILPGQIDRIFNPFVQAEVAMTRTHEGTGLGLSISRQLVALMGGVLDVESVPEQGSDFAFTIAFGLPDDADIALAANHRIDRPGECDAPPASALPLAGRRLLMVEDNQFNRQVLEGMLEQFGIEVDAALDGYDGVASFRVGCPYDAILMDLHMPGLDGYGCTRAIRLLPEGGQVPIIALTANVLPETRANCYAAGMNDVLVKPVEPEILHRALMHWIAGDPSDAPVNIVVPAAAEKLQADRLPDVLPGMDRAKAAAWSNGSARNLSELLERMLAHSGDDPAKISQHIAAGNIEAAAQITHDLMAVAATVGASTLVGAARQVNREIRAGSPDSTLAQEALKQIDTEFSHLNATRAILQQRQG